MTQDEEAKECKLRLECAVLFQKIGDSFGRIDTKTDVILSSIEKHLAMHTRIMWAILVPIALSTSAVVAYAVCRHVFKAI
jgi:hypothetical protein